MNARDQSLTDFEVFKAHSESFGGSPFSNDRRRYVAYRFESVWSDFMWNPARNSVSVDDKSMHLMRGTAIFHAVAEFGSHQVVAVPGLSASTQTTDAVMA